MLLCSLSLTAQTAETESRDISGFKHIIVRGEVDLYLSQGPVEKVLVETGRDVYTKLNGDVLTIYTPVSLFGKKKGKKKIQVDGGYIDDPKSKRSRKWWKKLSVAKVYVTAKTLNSLSAGGACDVKGQTKIRSDHMSLKCSGASDMVLELEADQLTANLSGASDIKISGSTRLLTVNSSGASDFKGKEFRVQQCNARGSGASDIFVHVEDALDYKTSGASDVHYSGNPRVVKPGSKKSKKPRP